MPTPTPAPTPVPPPTQLARLEDIFNLGRNAFGLVVAAIFGLAPNLVISALQQRIDEYKADLKSTEAPEGGSGS
jgi:hypothetical protein